jgi:hypothetical protein
MIRLYNIIILILISGLSNYASASHDIDLRLAISCVPKYVWDNGYNVYVYFDSDLDRFSTHVHAVSFFGARLLFSDDAQFTSKQIENSSHYRFSFQSYPEVSHSVTLTAEDPTLFYMDLFIEGKPVDSRFKILKCKTEEWFIQKYARF